MDGFRTLVEMIIPGVGVCGMIKFSPDCKSLFCCPSTKRSFWDDRHLGEVEKEKYLACLNINMEKRISCTFYHHEFYIPWEFESHSEAGFLLGDPISSALNEFCFVLNKQTVLSGSPFWSFINMLNVKVMHLFPQPVSSCFRRSSIVFSLSGEIVYVSSPDKAAVSVWNVSSRQLHIEQKRKIEYHHNLLAAVKEGVLLLTETNGFELWNFDLSQCVWNVQIGNIITNRIRKVIPISEELVACEVDKKVVILDTTSGKIVWTILIGSDEKVITCNSKCQLLIMTALGSVQLWDGKTTLWKNATINLFDVTFRFRLCEGSGFFSPSEQYVVIFSSPSEGKAHVVDSVSGETLHILGSGFHRNIEFISDEECVISSQRDYCLKLFNVKTGDLLSEIHPERELELLAACPRRRLLAIGESDYEHEFKLIQVHLPQDKGSRESKW